MALQVQVQVQVGKGKRAEKKGSTVPWFSEGSPGAVVCSVLPSCFLSALLSHSFFPCFFVHSSLPIWRLPTAQTSGRRATTHEGQAHARICVHAASAAMFVHGCRTLRRTPHVLTLTVASSSPALRRRQLLGHAGTRLGKCTKRRTWTKRRSETSRGARATRRGGGVGKREISGPPSTVGHADCKGGADER